MTILLWHAVSMEETRLHLGAIDWGRRWSSLASLLLQVEGI